MVHKHSERQYIYNQLAYLGISKKPYYKMPLNKLREEWNKIAHERNVAWLT